jgi:hypothetical protein
MLVDPAVWSFGIKNGTGNYHPGTTTGHDLLDEHLFFDAAAYSPGALAGAAGRRRA